MPSHHARQRAKTKVDSRCGRRGPEAADTAYLLLQRLPSLRLAGSKESGTVPATPTNLLTLTLFAGKDADVERLYFPCQSSGRR